MAPASFTCRYCKRPNVSRSLQGLKSHISQTPDCRARRDEEHALLNRNRSSRATSPHTCQQPAKHHTQQENIQDDTPPSDDADGHRSKRARVDDCDDDDSGAKNFRSANTNFIVDYPVEARAGAILEDSQDGLETRFEKIKRTQQHADKPAWAPFSSLADWDLSRWLIRSGVSQQEIDKFLKLESVRRCSIVPICNADSPPRFGLVLTHLCKTNTHSSRKSTASPMAQSGSARSSKSPEIVRMRMAMLLLRKLSFGEGTQLNVCES